MERICGTQGGPLMNQVGKNKASRNHNLTLEYSENVLKMSKYMCDIFKKQN